MKSAYERRSNRIPKSPRSHRKSFARTVHNEGKGKNISIRRGWTQT